MDFNVEIFVDLDIAKVWDLWTSEEHIMNWHQSVGEWRPTFIKNDLRSDGEFLFRMTAIERKANFDFKGTYLSVSENEHLLYYTEDGRKVVVGFIPEGSGTTIIETIEPEMSNSIENQKKSWEGLLDSFKRYAEAQ